MRDNGEDEVARRTVMHDALHAVLGQSSAWLSSARRAMQDPTLLLMLALLAAAVICAAHVQFSRIRWDSEWPWEWNSDISYIWFEGYHIRDGQNPYARILQGNMQDNNKYATYLPGFYLLAAATQVPFPWFSDWIFFWRIVFFALCTGIGLMIFGALYRRGWELMAVFAFLFWMFDRWTLHVLYVAQIDSIPIFFLVASLLLLKKHPWAALACLSVSLSVKHVAAVLVPLYLIWMWHSANRNRARRVGWAALVIASVPLLVSLPFVVWDVEAFVRSMLFSGTRRPDGHFGAPSVDEIVGLWGLPGKTLMLFMMSLIYVTFAQKRLPMVLSAALVIGTFLGFNSVLFRQYVPWLTALVPLVLLELGHGRGSDGAAEADRSQREEAVVMSP